MPKNCKAAALRVFVLVVCLWAPGSVGEAFSPPGIATFVRVTRLEEVAAGLATSMDVHKPVQVVVVPRNDLIVSVEPLAGADGYRVVFEQRFFDLLGEEELAAAIAHEIGHVWIYSHFPFLQTEALANEMALKAVRRKPLESLYGKLWAYIGVTGNIVELLGPPK
jgi:hypothetical protein